LFMAVNAYLEMIIEMDGLFADIEPEDILPRGHACKPIVQLTLHHFNATQLELKTNFLPEEIELICFPLLRT
jgi:hypothetical protein